MGVPDNSQEQNGKFQFEGDQMWATNCLEMCPLEPMGEHLFLSAISRGRGTELVNMGAAITTFFLELGPEQSGSDRMYKTASGSLISDGGPLVFSGIERARHLKNSSMAEEPPVHEVWASAGEIALRGGNDFFLDADGGYFILAQSLVG